MEEEKRAKHIVNKASTLVQQLTNEEVAEFTLYLCLKRDTLSTSEPLHVVFLEEKKEDR